MAGTAGSVAPVFHAEGYVATNIYDFYHAIIHNNKLYFCRQDGTVGHEPTGITDEYWFLSLDGNFGDAKKLGGESAAQWQTKIDVEKERIDQIVAMEEGTGGNVESEVLDMRIGADGITYDSAGTAVREQLTTRNVKTTKITEVPDVKMPLDEVLEAIEAKGAETLESIPADYTALSNEVESVKSDLSKVDYVLNDVAMKVPYDRQLFDVESIPTVPYKFGFRTSDKTFHADNWDRCYPIEVNGKTGETYTFNLLSEKAYSDYSLVNINLVASDNLPSEDASAFQYGVYNDTYMRGTIILEQDARYIIVLLRSNASLEEVDTKCNDALSNLVVRKGGYDTTYYTYEEYIKHFDVAVNQGVENAGKYLKVGSNGEVELSNVTTPQGISGDSAIMLRDTVTYNVGENIASGASVSLGSGWSGSLANGFTHSSGNTEPLSLTFDSEIGSAYIVEFDNSSITEGSVFLAFGSSVSIDTYDGSNHVEVGFISDGGSLKLIPTSAYSGTISNIKCRKVGVGTDTITLSKKNLTTGSDVSDITGFWNIALADDALASNINGSRNVAIGHQSLTDFESGTRNIGVGTFSMAYLKDGSYNVAIGADALWLATHAERCEAIGFASHSNGENSVDDVAIGYRAMGDNDANSYRNVAIGTQAGNYAHNNNTHVGYRSGYYTKGNNNTSIGCESGAELYNTGDNNIAIGVGSGTKAPNSSASNVATVNNTIAIGNNVKATESNQAVIGSSEQSLILCGKKITFNANGTVTWENA